MFRRETIKINAHVRGRSFISKFLKSSVCNSSRMSGQQEEQQLASELTASGGEQQVDKQKRQRKPRAPKEPKPAYVPTEIGVDSKGNKLFLGPMKGRFYVRTTKNGNIRKVYQVVKEGEDGSEEKVSRSTSRKRKAEGAPQDEPASKEARTSDGQIIEASTPEKACMLHVLV